MSSGGSNLRRLPLRELLNQADRRCRDLSEHLQLDMAQTIEELHKLARPVRKSSAYPTVRSISNSYEKMRRAYEYAQHLTAQIEEVIEAIESRVARS